MIIHKLLYKLLIWENIDCDGYWSDCTSACESAAQRIWTELEAQSGNGADCPVTTDCQPGDQGCPGIHWFCYAITRCMHGPLAGAHLAEKIFDGH